MVKVTYEFDVEEDEWELEKVQNASKYFSALIEIYNMVRNELKHGDEEISDHIDRLLEDIKSEASVVMDE